MEDKILNVDMQIKVTGEDVDDIMATALEGGINYWCWKAEVVGGYLGKYASEQISRGGELKLYDSDEMKIYTLNRDKFLSGLKRYIAFGNTACLFRETDTIGIYTGEISLNACMLDASAADMIIQYALFGDVIFG